MGEQFDQVGLDQIVSRDEWFEAKSSNLLLVS